jgi:hypothetical protein
VNCLVAMDRSEWYGRKFRSFSTLMTAIAHNPATPSAIKGIPNRRDTYPGPPLGSSTRAPRALTFGPDGSSEAQALRAARIVGKTIEFVNKRPRNLMERA